MQVTIYRVNSGFRNAIDRLTLNQPASDVIYNSAVYDLPGGYTTEVNHLGELIIRDEAGDAMEPCLKNRGDKSPVLLVSADKIVTLHKAAAAEAVNAIRAARIKVGMTQQQLADASGVNIRQIQRVELGSSDAGNLTARNLFAIADALGVDPRELI